VEIETLIEAGATRERAEALALADPGGDDAIARWRGVSDALRPADPFPVHRAAHAACFAAWDAGRLGPAPVGLPRPGAAAKSRLGQVLGELGLDLQSFHRRTVEAPEAHWSDMLDRLEIQLETPPERVLDGPATAPRWLPGARLNIAASALAGDDARPAILTRREGETELRTITLGELRRRAMTVARGLARAGLAPGNAIAIDMPMTADAVAIYLGIVAFGGAVVSIADSFSPAEIATRLRIAGARAIFTQDLIRRGDKRIPLYQRVAEAAAPRAIVLPSEETVQVELREGDQTLTDFLAGVAPAPAFHVAEPEAATNILFSSGTTGEPKAIPWTHVTPIKAASDACLHHDVRPGDVVAWPTNLGWMMGPWLVYASLLNRATIAVFDGPPHGASFGAFVADAGVTMLGVVPSLVRAWRANGALEGLDLSAVRSFSSTGETSSPDDMTWLMSRAGYPPVIEYCGGTELGGGYVAGTVIEPHPPSTFSTPCFGSDFLILDDAGRPADEGEVALVPPMLGSSSRLLNRDHHAVYFEGMPESPDGRPLRRHGDHMRRLPGGGYRALGRVDDTMNLGGIKVGSAELERVLDRVEGVKASAAVAVPPPEGGPSQLVVFAVADGAPGSLRAAMTKAIARELNPLFKLADLVLVDALPRTASGKVMRRVLRERYEDEWA
jgi:acetyl-CoA synthetase